MPDKSDRDVLDAIEKKVDAIEQVLKGYDGHTGLCKTVSTQGKQINKIWLVVAVFAGSVGGGGGWGYFKIYELIQKLAGG